jgi:hypothetical protein
MCILNLSLASGSGIWPHLKLFREGTVPQLSPGDGRLGRNRRIIMLTCWIGVSYSRTAILLYSGIRSTIVFSFA